MQRWITTRPVTLLTVPGTAATSVEHQLEAGQRFEIREEYGYGVTLLEYPVSWIERETRERRVTRMGVVIGPCYLEEHMASGAVVTC